MTDQQLEKLLIFSDMLIDHESIVLKFYSDKIDAETMLKSRIKLIEYVRGIVEEDKTTDV